MLVPLPAMKGQRAVIRLWTFTKGESAQQFLAQPTAIRVVVNVEENVFHVRDKETVRTKEIILFEYVSWFELMTEKTIILRFIRMGGKQARKQLRRVNFLYYSTWSPFWDENSSNTVHASAFFVVSWLGAPVKLVAKTRNHLMWSYSHSPGTCAFLQLAGLLTVIFSKRRKISTTLNRTQLFSYLFLHSFCNR